MNAEVVEIPVESIRVVNPRLRDKHKFSKIVESIRNLGLKKPIQVSPRQGNSEESAGYDLICGQGRMEAFQQLGYKLIPAIVMEATKEDRLLMSLIENLARRFASPIELVDEMLRLKKAGNTNVMISRKLDISECTVGDLLALGRAGEGRLLNEVIGGRIPIGVATEIAKVEGAAQQREFLEAYEKRQLNQAAIRSVRRVLVQREAFGKKLTSGGNRSQCKSSESLVNTFKKESQRQKILVKKTKLCEARLLFIVEAFKRVTSDEDFVNLLRAEEINTMPKELADLIAKS